MQATVDVTNTYRMFGLSNGDSSVLHTDIDFAAYLAGSSFKVYEGGANRGTFGTLAPGDVVKVSVQGGVVRYYLNNAFFRIDSARRRLTEIDNDAAIARFLSQQQRGITSDSPQEIWNIAYNATASLLDRLEQPAPSS